jgi:hypothetical protein
MVFAVVPLTRGWSVSECEGSVRYGGTQQEAESVPDSDGDPVGPELPVFSEHREVCAFLLGLMAGSPGASPFWWLDLGCGEMRVLDAARHALFEEHRARIRYVGYDRVEPTPEARSRLSNCGFAWGDVVSGELGELRNKLGPSRSSFGLITLTNTLHEVEPEHVAGLLCDSVAMLDRSEGVFLAFDVEWLTEPETEPGRATWSWVGITNVMQALLQALGWSPREVVAQWRTRNATGWTVVASCAGQCPACESAAAREATNRAVKTALRDRRSDCERALEAYSDRTPRTAVGGTMDMLEPDEKTEVQRNLWLYYGLSRFSKWIDSA